MNSKNFTGLMPVLACILFFISCDQKEEPNTLRQAGCIFGLTALQNNASAKPFGEWNNSRIVQRDGKLTCWLNGITSSEVTLNSDQWNELVAASNFKALPAFGKATSGHIVLQDWAKGISFRNIKIKEYR